MKSLYQFLRISNNERRLLIYTVFLVTGIRFGLWLIPFVSLQRLLAKIAQPSHRPYASPEAVVWAVGVASRYIPKATCLTQALAAQVLRQRHGYPPGELCIGVLRNEGGPLQAHAWVESDEEILIGKVRTLSHFTRLKSLVAGVDNFKWSDVKESRN